MSKGYDKTVEIFEAEASIKEKGMRIHAYVIMPNHIHMIVFDRKFYNAHLQQALAAYRKYTGRRLADYIENNLSESLALVIRSKELEDRDRQVWHLVGMQRVWSARVSGCRRCTTSMKNLSGRVMCACLNNGDIPRQGIG